MASSDEYEDLVVLEPDSYLLSKVTTKLNDYLTEVIFSFVPTREILANRKRVRYKIEECVRNVLPRSAKVELFGSCAIGIDTLSSDLDIIVLVPFLVHHNPSSKKDRGRKVFEGLSELKKLSKELRRSRYGGTVKNVFNARIPIIQFTHKETNIDCDIKLGRLTPNESIVPVHRLKSKFVTCIINADDRIRQLILLIKKWAKARELNDASKGTLNSFGFTFLAIFFAQRLPKPLAPILDCVNYEGWFNNPNLYKDYGHANKMSIAEIFVTFFDFYQQFPFDELAVCVREERLIEASSLTIHDKQRRCMIIQDPFDPKDNVARNIKDDILKLFQKEFTRAVEVLLDCPDKLFKAPVRPLTKNQQINKYIRTQKRKGVRKEKFNIAKAKKELKVSEKRIQKALDKIYYKRKKANKETQKR